MKKYNNYDKNTQVTVILCQHGNYQILFLLKLKEKKYVGLIIYNAKPTHCADSASLKMSPVMRKHTFAYPKSRAQFTNVVISPCNHCIMQKIMVRYLSFTSTCKRYCEAVINIAFKPRHEQNLRFAYAKTKEQISCTVTWQLISAFVLLTR